MLHASCHADAGIGSLSHWLVYAQFATLIRERQSCGEIGEMGCPAFHRRSKEVGQVWMKQVTPRPQSCVHGLVRERAGIICHVELNSLSTKIDAWHIFSISYSCDFQSLGKEHHHGAQGITERPDRQAHRGRWPGFTVAASGSGIGQQGRQINGLLQSMNRYTITNHPPPY